MSLAINVDKVFAVLLADGWHDVDKDAKGIYAFGLDSYEYVEGTLSSHGDYYVLLGGGMVAGVPSTGFIFWEGGVKVIGPITAVLAVKEKP